MYIFKVLYMDSINSLSSINSAALIVSKHALSNETISKLKEFGINIASVSSETEAKQIIKEKTEAKERANNANKADARFEKIYQRIRTLATRLDISVSSSEKVETVLNKIDAKISMLEENNNNANISAVRSEYDSIKYTYETLTSVRANLFTGLDILGKTNRVVMGITDIKK